MNIQAINAELAKIGYKAVKLPKPKNGLNIWAKRRIARSYKGIKTQETGKYADWKWCDIGIGFLVGLYKDKSRENDFTWHIERYLKVNVPPRKLARQVSHA